MGNKWYDSRTNQAATIGGIFLVLSTLVASFFATRVRSPYPLLEIKSFDAGGEEVLSRLALTPAQQLVDSAAFGNLDSRTLLVNDSLGVAIDRPSGQPWTAGDLGQLDEVSIDDVPLVAFISDMLRTAFEDDTLRTHPRFFGVRLDFPTRLRLLRDTRLKNVVIGDNPFADPRFTLGWVRLAFQRPLTEIPRDSVIAAGVELRRTMDSVIRAKVPITRNVYSGVFIARLAAADLPLRRFRAFLKRDLLDDVLNATLSGVSSPALLVFDRDRRTIVLNETITLANSEVNGRRVPILYVNRVGYVLETRGAAYMVLLQYLSSDERAVLAELERLFRSVRIRRSAT